MKGTDFHEWADNDREQAQAVYDLHIQSKNIARYKK